MALINCPSCSKPVSDKASSCPHCGTNLTQIASEVITPKLTKTQSIHWYIMKCAGVLLTISFLGSFLYSNSYISWAIWMMYIGIFRFLFYLTLFLAVKNKSVKNILGILYAAIALHWSVAMINVFARGGIDAINNISKLLSQPTISSVVGIVGLISFIVIAYQLRKTSFKIPIAIWLIYIMYNRVLETWQLYSSSSFNYFYSTHETLSVCQFILLSITKLAIGIILLTKSKRTFVKDLQMAK